MKCKHGIDPRTCWFCLGHSSGEYQDEIHDWEIRTWLEDALQVEDAPLLPPDKTRIPLRAVEIMRIMEQAPRTFHGSGAGPAGSGSPHALHAA